ncbi:MAG: 23S rRNA (guanosine(2251)-2'-O)-methyltransferase RlmB [Nitrospina sp.]|nr:23S rRNA (guanosine(2251)-2'-O)-methyltransferase RlmB [Nitrospina sp.]MBT3413813.1 23S rRNA (guanosine(2251)-2'-O)-methyltransferase RlmB [Nitrospina sp.]MBT3856403.1 23S rRNA (guanosine(2251)-2'-O)-methyltransferase RlmB [Nitrospina sp.]MBT4104935.1 23S rRNA (guanosine(2251)-2'-O)-methyltransferase RlmB [Nitrospina sp.]MBT4388226.1 23S rRNA (guanosine(2251)-2'-O)-methyltransferase RlmB [Nitrospina sp.]
MKPPEQTLIVGINPVREALLASRRHCYKLFVEQGKTPPRIQAVVKLAQEKQILIEPLPKATFQKKFPNQVHQGLAGYFSHIATLELEDLIEIALQKTPLPTLVILDGIQDPQNLGAIIRSAETLGIQGLILPKHGSPALNETVAKCSSGAIEHLPITWVTNLTRCIEQLKEAGFWIAGVVPDGEIPCYQYQFNTPSALVIGGEEKGIRPLLKKSCDVTLTIPMQGQLGSLNAASASTVVFYENLRQKKLRDATKG